MVDIIDLNKDTGILGCLECGKCTAVCPVSRIGGTFSPRSLMTCVVSGDYDGLAQDGRIWDCLTCGQCTPRCPHNIDFSVFCRKLRPEAISTGNSGTASHDGALHHIMQLQSFENLKQNRLEWVPKDAKIAEEGEVLYFVGCLPYYDAYFDHLKLGMVDIGKSALKIFNHLGIEPVVMADERCCGHDLVWSGETDKFLQLARRNVEAIRKTGAKKIVFSCAECYRTLSREYAEFLEPIDAEMMHMAQFLDQQVAAGKLSLDGNGTGLTYHDPCRLGRQMGVIDEPRRVLSSLSGGKFTEMDRHGKSAVCCGTSSWMNCNMTSKKIQSARLAEAGATGAGVMVTACPKCRIHFECTKTDPNLPDESRVAVKDLTVVAAEAL
jgi:heterodisulfide reductase subunit D